MKTTGVGCKPKAASCSLGWAVVLVGLVACAFSVRGAEPAERTKSLIAVLQSDTSFFEKARACQQLGEIGTAQAVPVLAGLLADPKLSAYARSGLEGIPDPSAAAALRRAVQDLKGPLLAGVINSLGVLRDAQSTELLTQLASDTSSGVSKEALLVLGNIATQESIRPIQELLINGKDAASADAAAAGLLAAEQTRARGDLALAAALYDLIRNAKVPTACRVGATRGAILARTGDRVSFLMEQLRSGEPAIRNAALLTIRDIPDDSLANALNREIASVAPELQVQLLLAIADCHNSGSIPVVASLDSSQSPEVRKAALNVLGRLGPAAAPALLTALQEDRASDERAIVLMGLRSMEGTGVDDFLITALHSAKTPPLQVDLIRLLDSRGVSNAAPEILKLAADGDTVVSIAALSAMRTLGGPNELQRLMTIAKSAVDPGVRDAVENALAGICSRSGEAACQTVLQALTQATRNAERNCWIRVLGQVGYSKALPAIEAAVADPDSEVAANALAQLGHWPNPEPMETLLKAVGSSATPDLRKQTIVAVIDLMTTVTDEGLAPDAKVVGWVQRVQPALKSVEDKRRILAVLGRLKTIESFELLNSYLEDEGLRTEAASGILQIAPALSNGDKAAELKAALEEIAFTVSNSELKSQARKLAKGISVQSSPVSLFNRQSLAGWEGGTNVWRVREGVIVGGSLKGNPRNEFLATVRTYTNFLLRLEYKLVGTEGFVNSGVQFRSVRMSNPANEMNGYQADIGAGYSGCLYDESRRNTFLARASQELIQRLEKTNDWNHYEVRAEGRHIRIRLNGELTVEYTELDATLPQWGLIGLQIHGGNKAEVSFREITIQEF